MLELLAVIVGIVLLWKFATSINAISTAARAKTEVMSEKIIAEVVEDRSIAFEAHKQRMEGKTVYSHEEIMAHFKTGD